MTSDSPPRAERALSTNWTGLPNLLVHFVGRTRGGKLLPPEVPQSAPERTASILMTRLLLASKVPSSGEDRVVCASDVSAVELEAAFERGINRRGAFQPWAVVLDRVAVYNDGIGMRPVHYVDHSRLDAYRKASEKINGPGWGGLAIPIRLTSRLGSYSDWMHEREWRWCARPESKIPVLSIKDAIKAVVVNEQGWEPEWHLESPFTRIKKGAPEYTVERWLWDPKERALVKDGLLTVPERPFVEPADSGDAEVRPLVELRAADVASTDVESASETTGEAYMEPEQILVPSETTASPWVWSVMCPACGDGNVDRYGPEGFGPDEQAVTVHPDKDEYGSPIGTRGGWVTVDLLCAACGHYFALVLANHKGAERVGIVSH